MNRFRSQLILLTLFEVVTCAAAQPSHGLASTNQLLNDPSFESLSTGILATTGISPGWEVQRTGRAAIQEKLVVSCSSDPTLAKSGQNCISLSIPKQTVGFEFVTVGQRRTLVAGKEYEASLWVRWEGGPKQKAHTESVSRPSAIVSFWACHQNGEGTFAGRDDWLYNNRWKRHSFRFRAISSTEPTFVYVSLLPNQKPVDTTLLVDDFELHELSDGVEAETRMHQLVVNHDFSNQEADSLAPPWYFANMGGNRITGEIVQSDGERYFRLAMGPSTTNFESAQLWQHLHLQEGTEYEISCRMRWDNFSMDAARPIVNYGIYHDKSNTWYGPVDQVLEKSDKWQVYKFRHIPPYSGTCKLYVQLNGWGNFGSSVTVCCDDLECIVKNSQR